MRTIMLSLLAVFAVSVSAQGTKAEQIRKTFQKYQDSVATLTWTNTTSAMRQEVERERSTTVVMLPGGVGMVSASATKSRASGMASMFGGGGGSKDSGWKFNIGEGISCESVSEDSETNLRFFNAPSKLAGISFPEKVSVPALAEEVLIISAHNKTLKFAKFFRLARINAVIEDGQIYGLDGSIGDCVGALVVTLDGKVLGIVGEMKADEESGGGGIGGMLGGLDNPGAGSNRVLLTPSVFAASIVAAKKAIEGKSAATSDKPAASGVVSFKSTVASAVKREARKDVFVLVNVPEDQTAPEEGATVSILSKEGKSVGEFEVTRRYKNIAGDRIEQVGGSVKNATGDISEGMSAVTYLALGKNVPEVELVSGEETSEIYGAKAGFKVKETPAAGSPEEKAGLKKGDLIVKFGETSVTAATKLEDFKKWYEGNATVKITIARAGSTDLTDIVIE
ncbi:MAG: hypothetical protein L3J82_11000 [Planctomycetes bacterium]|nr:hypothetical protein [Planctomycetota bacterium]